MGFSDSFKKIQGQFSPIPGSSKEFRKATQAQGAGLLTGNVAGGAAAIGQERFKDDSSSTGRAFRLNLGAISPGQAIASDRGQAKVRSFLKGDDTKPPPVGAAPAQGAGQTEAQRAARKRAVEAAGQRFGFRQTVATSALGVQGEGAQLGTKKLLGE